MDILSIVLRISVKYAKTFDEYMKVLIMKKLTNTKALIILNIVLIFLCLAGLLFLYNRNQCLLRLNRELERNYEYSDNRMFHLQENQKYYLLYNNMKEISDVNLKNEKDSLVQLSSLLSNSEKIIVRISETSCLSCIQSFCNRLSSSGIPAEKVIYIADYKTLNKLSLMKKILNIEQSIYRTDSLNLPIEKEEKSYVFVANPDLSINRLFLPVNNEEELNNFYLSILKTP